MSANYDSSMGATGDTAASKTRSAGRSFSEQSGRVVEEVQELGRTAVSSLSDAATSLREKGHDALEVGKERASQARSDFDRLVAAHPGKAVLIALGAGAMLGFMLHRRRD